MSLTPIGEDAVHMCSFRPRTLDLERGPRRYKYCGLLAAFIVALAVAAPRPSYPVDNNSLAYPRPFTVADGISSTRFLCGRDGSKVFLSPDARRYFVALVSGDIQSDKVWLDIRVGKIASDTATVPASIVRLSTSALGPGRGMANRGTTSLSLSRLNIPRWIDSQHIAFLWSDDRSINQVYVLDVLSGRGQFITRTDDDVVAFAASPGGAMILDVLNLPDKAAGERAFAAGFAVVGDELDPLLAGFAPGTSAFSFEDFQRYMVNWRLRQPLTSLTIPGAIRQGYDDILDGFGLPGGSIISPNGQFAVLDESPNDIGRKWDKYSTPEIESVRNDPAQKIVTGRSNTSMLRQLFLLDLRSKTSAPLLDAPYILGDVKQISWSPDGRWLLLGPTYLPASETEHLAVKNWAVIDLRMRKVGAVIQLPEVGLDAAIEWGDGDRFTVRTPSGRQFVGTLEGGHWAVVSSSASATAPLSLRLKVVEDLNHPPKLEYADMAGRTTVLLDPNPSLATVHLARVEMVEWTDRNGEKWEARFYKPTSGAGPWPLVVQTHGYAKADEFSLYGRAPDGGGEGLGPSYGEYLAQALATQEIGVLQVGGPTRKGQSNVGFTATFEFLEQRTEGIADGIHELVKRELVDPSRVGLQGYSATGRLVENALTRGNFRYAAAIIVDAADLNYVQNVMYHYGRPIDRGNNQPVLGAPEMVQWIARSPALNADRVQTPIQYQAGSWTEGRTTFMWHWEMYSALKAYGKAVEYYVHPDFRHSAHNLQNPGQLMAVQSRGLDWWLFWLKGAEDPDPVKRAQYQSWEQMRSLVEKAQQEPQRPLLEWSSRKQ
jgi:dipeptidyl aminopeptidase/acylaminoacyl peptidase